MAENKDEQSKVEQPQVEQPAGEAAKPKDNLPPVAVEVEDLGSLRKRLKITVPAERIAAKRAESIKQLSTSALVPGFRIGRAPRRLIEKRYAPELSNDVKAAMIGLGYSEALENSKLKVLGEPDLDDAKYEAITIPETGPLTFDVEVEVQPDFELPALEGIAVTRPPAGVTDNQLAESMKRWQGNFATTEPVEGPAKADDLLTADMTFQVEGGEKHEHADQSIAVRAHALEGIPLEDLGDRLAEATAGQTITVETTVPAGFPEEALAGKKATFTFAVKAVKRIRLPELDDAFVGKFGFESAEAFRGWMRDRLEAQSQSFQQEQMREQVYAYLLGQVKLDLPAGVLARMKERTLARRANELMTRGVPRGEIDKHVNELAVQAGEEAGRDLKTLFIMQRVAEQLKVQVTEQDVNALVAKMAAQYNRRPDNLRDELERRNAMSQLVQQIQETKAVDELLAKAKIEDAPAAPTAPAAPPTPASPSA